MSTSKLTGSAIERKVAGSPPPSSSNSGSKPVLPTTPVPDDAHVDAMEALVKKLSPVVQFDSVDLKQAQSWLTQLKIGLTKFQLLPPFTAEPNKVKRQLLIAREALEAGAFLSIKAKDIPAFERHVAQLKTYYTDYAQLLPPSERQYPITGLCLLALLAQNRIGDFHTELELIPLSLQQNPYIKYTVTLEQRLMEGSYNKILNARDSVPHPAMAVFIDLLSLSVRDKLSECAEKAYESFPVADALAMLTFKTRNDLIEYAKKRGWEITKDDVILFPATHGAAAQHAAKQKALEIPSRVLIRQTLGYATELERIV